jgi:predicted DsbA family dithiol-disulfide isomerase
MQAAAPDATPFDPEDYDILVPQLGIRVDEFNACMAEGRFADRVNADFEDALQAGAIASPFSIVLIEGREPITIRGSVPYGTLTQIIDSVD